LILHLEKVAFEDEPARAYTSYVNVQLGEGLEEWKQPSTIETLRFDECWQGPVEDVRPVTGAIRAAGA
jgi:hypothetical protein